MNEKEDYGSLKAIVSLLNKEWAFAEFEADGTIHKTNANFNTLFGYDSSDNITGMHHNVLCHKKLVNSVAYEQFWEGLRRGDIQRGEFKRKHKNGATIWINAAYSPVTDDSGEVTKIIKIAADVTLRKKLLKSQFEQSEQRFQSIIQENINAMLLVSDEGRIELANKKAAVIFGYSIAEMMYLKIQKLVPNGLFQDKNSLEDYLKHPKLLEADMAREIYGQTQKGKLFPVEISLNPIMLDDKQYVLATIEDITEKLRIERELIQSEKMASLGTLMAGIAHEINTPLGAIKASIEGILDKTKSYQRLIDLVEQLGPNQRREFIHLIEDAINQDAMLTTKEERALRRRIKAELNASEIFGDYDDLSDILADLKLVHGIDSVEHILKAENRSEILSTAFDITIQHRNGRTIQIAVEKAAKVIYALKSYTHFSQTDELEEVDLIAGIENVLMLYQNQLKQGISLVKHYNEIPRMRCYGDQINQVWSNLISNAIHAMKGKGNLKIHIQAYLKHIVVRIEDSGTGIPESIQDQIFNPFFTTKATGEGSGLGLDLVRKIVKKHGGSIHFKTSNTGTAFFVHIPKPDYIEAEIEKHVLTDQ